jgi:hypothetical protein
VFVEVDTETFVPLDVVVESSNLLFELALLQVLV